MAAVTNLDESQAHILKLPPELMETVATHVPAEDLLALRLTCRDMSSKVLRTFAVVHFTDKTFLLASTWSMEALENISKHATFGRSLKKVRLSVEEVLSSREDARKREHQAKPSSRKERRSNREARRIHCEISAEQSSCMHAHKWKHSLSRALTTLKEAGQGVSLDFRCQQAHDAASPTGEKLLERALGYQGCFSPFPLSAQYPFPTLLETLLEVRCPIHYLTLGGDNFPVGVDLFNSTSLRNDGFAAAFGRLRKLDLRLDLVTSAHGRRYMTEDLRQAAYLEFAEMLSKLAGLETLIVRYTGGFWGMGNKLFKVLASSAYLPALSEVELHGMATSANDLILFLTRQKQTLTRVVVVGLDPAEGYTMTLQEIVDRVESGAGDIEIDLDLRI